MHKDHIPLGVGFYPDWFYTQYGISFGREYYFDPETRVAARMEIDRRLYEKFGDLGLGNPDPQPKPLITFGMVMLPSIFGCEIIYKDDALPWAMPLNLSEDEIMRLEVPDIFHSYPMIEMIQQIDHLKERYGKVVGDINATGVQNLALKIRGDQLYIDFFENPELCRHLLGICAECIIQLFEFNRKTTGTGAIDVTPMCDPSLFVLPNCTAEQISLDTYENFVLEYDNRVADACHPVGIHHCGSVDEVLDGYAKVHHLEFIEIGFGSDVKHTREVFGPKVAVNARISPVLMKNGTTEEVAAEVRRLIDTGAPLENFSIDTVGLTYGTPDENVRTALRTAAEYGTIDRETPSEGKRRFFYGSGKGPIPVETSVSSKTKTVTIGPSRPLVIIGERINPTGRKKLAQALEEGDLDLVRSEAVRQVAEGAHILDINVGVSGIDEPDMLRKAVLAVQEVIDVPLCIDSALPEALAAGLDAYKGKALVNSVNGEKHKLERVLPLVRDYGAAVIGLTMDDNGIPKSAEKRLDIARRIVDRAERERAFEALARDVGARALSVARGLLGSRAAAEDAVQEAFERAYRSLDGYRGEAQLSTWFLRIVVNTAHRHGRRGRRRLLNSKDLEGCELRTASGAESPEARTEAAEIRLRLATALWELPRRQRAAFVLRYVEGMSTDETAAVMECAAGTVKATLHKAVGKLRRALQDLQVEELR